MKKEENHRELVPKRRFPGFRDAEEWSSKPMGEIYSYKGNNSLSRDKLNYENGSIRNIHYGDIHTKFSSLFDITKEFVPYVNASEQIASFKAENYCIEGDMIFADASEDLADIGKCIELINLNGERVVSGLHTILARQTSALLILSFGGHLFKSYAIRKQIQKESQGAKVLGLSGSRLARITIPFPHDKNEQRKIADCLTSLDDLIRLEAEKLDFIKAHKKGLMQQLFPAELEKLPRLRFPEFLDANEWDEKVLGPMTTKIGSGITPTGGDKNYKTEGRPFVRSQNVGWGELILNDIAFIDESTHKSFDSTEIRTNDVLLNITGASIGRSAIADSRIAGGNVNQHVCIIRTKPDELNHALLNQFFISERGQKQIDSFQAGGNRQGLNFAQIRSFFIPLPPTETEQKAVADCLSSLDELIASQAQKLDTLKTHKKGLMQQLFPQVGESVA